jgi:TM2 domain-containing membrane protein YozV
MNEIKSSGVAILLSFFWTGLGQLYAGRIARGLVMMVSIPLVWLLGFAGLGGVMASLAGKAGPLPGVIALPLALTPLAAWLYGMIDARALCELHNANVKAQADDPGRTEILSVAHLEKLKQHVG